MGEPIQLYPDQADDPVFMAQRSIEEYHEWSKKVQEGGHLGFPWSSVSNMIGPLLPGFLVLVGARAKGGKSTFLRSVFDAWVSDYGKRVLYVGTEQSAGILRGLWACLRLRLPTAAAMEPGHPNHADIKADVAKQISKADNAMIVAEPAITVETFIRWARYAYRMKCDALIFDHFHRLKDEGTSQHRSRNSAIQDIKNVAVKSNMVILVAAQLTNGEGGSLGEYEVPGCNSWAETAGLRRECDAALQLWRPFQVGVTREQKLSAKDDASKLADIVQPNVMGVRCDAHRYRNTANLRPTRLVVNEGELSSWSSLG